MTTRYTSRHPGIRWPLVAIDTLLRAAMRIRSPRRPDRQANEPSRILVCNQAHLGDAILATALLPAIRRRYPAASIGMLVHPVAVDLLSGHPDIRWLHTVEHALLNRRDEALPVKWLRYARGRRHLIREIARLDYDVAVDSYHYFPNSIGLLWSAGIPRRIGWTSGGLGPLLTQHLDDPEGGMNILDRHAALANLMCGEVVGPVKPTLSIGNASNAQWRAKAEAAGLKQHYDILHIGANAPHRRWPVASWIALARQLDHMGRSVALLGWGTAEGTICRQIRQAVPGVVDLSNAVDLHELAAAIAGCDVLVCHDSAPAHLGTAFERRRVVIAAGINPIYTWLQPSETSAVLTRDVPCAPCGRSQGCSTMACVRGVSVDSVIAAVRQISPADHDQFPGAIAAPMANLT